MVGLFVKIAHMCVNTVIKVSGKRPSWLVKYHCREATQKVNYITILQVKMLTTLIVFAVLPAINQSMISYTPKQARSVHTIHAKYPLREIARIFVST